MPWVEIPNTILGSSNLTENSYPKQIFSTKVRKLKLEDLKLAERDLFEFAIPPSPTHTSHLAVQQTLLELQKCLYYLSQKFDKTWHAVLQLFN
jgi:hypothetical protein